MTSARIGALWLIAAALILGLAVIGLGHVRWGGLDVSFQEGLQTLVRSLIVLERKVVHEKNKLFPAAP